MMSRPLRICIAREQLLQEKNQALGFFFFWINTIASNLFMPNILECMDVQRLLPFSPRINNVEGTCAAMIDPCHPWKNPDTITRRYGIRLKYSQRNLVLMFIRIQVFREIDIRQVIKRILLSFTEFR